MTSSLFPEDGFRVEMEAEGEFVPGIRVVRSAGPELTLSMAAADVPPAGTAVTLRWSAAPRGRNVVTAVVVAADENRVEVRMTADPAIAQSRRFVRGGGGEAIVMYRPGLGESIGWVHDIGESSVRAHFTDIEVRPGHEMDLRIQLGMDVAEFHATALKASAIRQQVPFRGPLSVELVALFDQDESQARIVRRYIIQNQLQARRTAAAAV
ncbi:hypothetical protein [Actinoplanes sp. NPDC051851]|uniref:hypothetical protein n=1 Tax=Actinoplanes sp. NPDC051851 TaxID=3154753 RepID=UPI00342613CD